MESEAIIGILVLGGLILLVVALVRYGQKINKRKIVWYQNLALKLGFKHEFKKHFFSKLNYLKGHLDGHPVTIYEKITGSGKHQQLNTMISFEPNPFDFEFRISKEGFFAKIGKAFGGQDIEFGSEELDKKFIFKSNHETKFKALLDYKAQQELMLIAPKLGGSICCEVTNFYYMLPGGFVKEEHIAEFEKVMDFMRLLLQNKR